MRTSPLRIMGRRLERYQNLLKVAQKIPVPERLSPHAWRVEFSKRVIRAFHRDDLPHLRLHHIARALNSLSPEQLKAIRVACIGPEKEAEFFDQKTGKLSKGRATLQALERHSDSNAVREARNDAQYANALANLKPEERTVPNIARVLGFSLVTVSCYASMHPTFAAMLVDKEKLFRRSMSS